METINPSENKARLMPLEDGPVPIKPHIGLMTGTFSVPDDFNAPLPTFENDFYGP